MFVKPVIATMKSSLRKHISEVGHRFPVLLPSVIATFVIFSASFKIHGSSRDIRSINDGWKFSYAGDTSSVKVRLPHSWNGDAYSRRDYRRGEGTYMRSLALPAGFEGKRVYLKFDGAASASEVSIDDKKAGDHVGAYSSHILDITPFVSPETRHQLTVKVNNADRNVPPYSADFTFMGGLYRDAWLMGLSPLHLDIVNGPEEGFKATPLLLPDGTCRLTVEGRVVNHTGSNSKLSVTVTLRDASGKVVGKRSERLNIPDGQDRPFKVDLDKLEGLDLWSPESPALYRVETEVTGRDGSVTDSGDAWIGFRSFSFDDAGRFILNGKPYKLRGMCRHQDQKPMGIALSDEQHRRDMQLIKDMGANFIRISHYPQDDAVLEMCDRLGLIAWEEIPVIDYVPEGERFADNSETMLREMIRRHYNHPSVVMWGYMNEILLRTPREGRDATYARTLDLARHLEDVLAEEDSTRMSTMAFHGSDVYHEAGLGEITDVKGWNLYQGWYGGRFPDFEAYLSRQHREHPDHKLIVSEYGAGSDLRIHSLHPQAFDFSMEYQQDYLEHYLPVIEDSVFVAGASHWNFIDFSSANRAESMPHINNKGLVTNDRRKKDVYHYYRAKWHDLPTDTVAHIAVRDWQERTDVDPGEGKVNRPVKVYTNLPMVSLRVNGSLLPVQDVANCTAVFDVPFHDGMNLIELLSADGKRVLDASTVNMHLLHTRDNLLDLGTDEMAVNVGSDCYFRSDDSGLTWLPDRQYAQGEFYGHSGGSRSVSQDEIELTSDMPLLQRSLTGLEEYRFDLVPGQYEIEMSFADLSSPSALSAYMLGHNAGSKDTPPAGMDIVINGSKVETSFMPGVEAGVKTMVTRRYRTEVTEDGVLRVNFTPAGGTTSLAAIKVRKL